MQTNKNYFYIFIIVFILSFGAIFLIQSKKVDLEIKRNEERKENIARVLSSTPILAKAYSIYDITSNEKIYGNNDDIPLPLASLAKIMSVSIALNKNKGVEPVIISKNSIKQEGDFTLKENEVWDINDLSKLTLICSANDGVYAMSEKNKNYLNEMNEKARKLGLTATRFYNATGLDIGGHSAGAYGSASDVNMMTVYVLRAYPNIFMATSMPDITLTSRSGFTHTVKNTNILAGKIPNLIFSKTGFTGISGGNLTIVYKNKNGHDIAITVLGSTFEGRFTDMEKLVNILELSYGGTD